MVVNGSVGYASQEAWVFSASVRDNILFGLPYDAERYNAVIEACALKKVYLAFYMYHDDRWQ